MLVAKESSMKKEKHEKQKTLCTTVVAKETNKSLRASPSILLVRCNGIQSTQAALHVCKAVQS